MKKKQKEMAAKMEEKHREAKQKFRSKVESQINEFLKKENEKTLKFSAMDQYHRSVVHDVAEIAGLVTYSIGEEDVDRHIQVDFTVEEMCMNDDCFRSEKKNSVHVRESSQL